MTKEAGAIFAKEVGVGGAVDGGDGCAGGGADTEREWRVGEEGAGIAGGKMGEAGVVLGVRDGVGGGVVGFESFYGSGECGEHGGLGLVRCETCFWSSMVIWGSSFIYSSWPAQHGDNASENQAEERGMISPRIIAILVAEGP